ncbi:MAG TPA: transcriptional repressor LexA [Candidatus Paceibacterota bacterium]
MLTPRQKQILDFVQDKISKKGVAPTHHEIAKRLGLSSVATVHEHLQALENKGYLTKRHGQARGIEARNSIGMVKIPLLGYIAAGEPIEAIETKDTIAIPANRVPRTGNLFALTVQGDSMTEENINDGDTVLVKQQQTAENGQTVVALIDGDRVTVKKFYREKDKVRLQPANKSLDPIYVRGGDLTIQGIVYDVIKNTFNSPEIPVFASTRSQLSTKKPSPLFRQRVGSNFGEFYLGDSLQVIPLLEREYKTIYLDPPFNSNRRYTYSAAGENFGFVDRWADGDYEQWLDAMLVACKRKLAKDGTLFFHISAELSLVPQIILKKHFSKVEPIFWKKAHGKNTVKNKLGSVVDVIFKASNNGSTFNLLHVPLDAYYFENSYRNKDEIGLYALGSIKHDKTRKGHMYRYEKNGLIYEASYGWKIPKERLMELMKQNRIHFAKPKSGTNRAMLYKKLYKHETKGKPLSNLWDDIAYITRTAKDQRLYPTQKPFDLLKRIVELSSNPGDWVLDPVAGGGTTGAAALSLNRNTTLIDISREAGHIIKKRLENITR